MLERSSAMAGRKTAGGHIGKAAEGTKPALRGGSEDGEMGKGQE